MSGVSEADVAAAIGRIDEIIIREVVRTEASRHELRRALVLAKAPLAVEAEGDLSPRMQRLVDLLMVALPEPERHRRDGGRRTGRARHAA
ncbi:MAG TPA: hypothetical protein VGN82_01000 [Bosea sp. (in: a-proteobacteria)]|jgi:hypothetical protein|uniref:hypothetical protein n=1 Tax=Bosea sp. (in: a-proteobacteria) TaxID=1871050 RepID=UPI002E0E8C13|nr:hypothetical protein [Bosea sp. (in: a-proteobacteria)]